MGDEISIDLRRYLNVIVQHWHMIISVTVVAVIVTTVFVLAFPPGYEAVASVAIVKIKTDLEFDPRFKTTSEDLLGSGYAQAMGAEARRSALVGLVENGEIARQVKEQLGLEIALSALLHQVSADLLNKGDLIQIKVSDSDPEQAANIANAWAQIYESQVNKIYSGQTSRQYALSVEAELERVRQQYTQAQTDLEAFTAQNQIAELNRLITEKQQMIDTLQNGKQAAVISVVDEELKTRQSIINAYLKAGAQNSLLAFNKEQEAKQALVTGLIEAETQARLTAFQKEREARTRLFAQYVDAEISGRLAAFDKEHEARTRLFAQYVDTEINNQLLALDTEHAARLELFTRFVEAEVSNRQLVFNKDQEVRTKLFAQYVDAEINNRLLAFDKDQATRTALFNQYIETEIKHRLLAFNTDSDARARLFAQYVEAETNNRLAALAQEQQAKQKAFAAYAEADSQAKLTVFNEQVKSKLQTLARAYETRLKLETLLADARALQAQVRQGGNASASSNALAILLLKAEVFASSGDLPGTLQLQLNPTDGLEASAATQASDLQALTGVLEKRLQDLETSIEELSKDIYDNQGYTLLTAERSKDDPLYKAMRQKYGDLFEVDELAKAGDSVPQSSALAQAIQDKYNELFSVGTLARSADVVWQDSDLMQAVQTRYNELFGVGALAQAASGVTNTVDSDLRTAIQTRYEELFGVDDLNQSDTNSEESDLSQAILDKYQALFGMGALAQSADTLKSKSDLNQAIQARYRALFEVGDLAKSADTVWQEEELAQAILAKYDELFGVGTLGQMAMVISPTTPILTELKAQYPELFSLGDLPRLAEDALSNTPLRTAANQTTQELLQLKDLERLPGYGAAAQPMAEAIDTLQADIRRFQTELEQQKAKLQNITQVRDMAWETYTTLARKQAEVSIAQSVTGSEVRFASPALPPNQRTASRSRSLVIAGLVSLLMGGLTAFGLEYLGIAQAICKHWGNSDVFWRRIVCWLVTAGPGLPDH